MTEQLSLIEESKEKVVKEKRTRFAVYKVRLIKESVTMYGVEKVVKSPKDAADILQNYLEGLDREHFVAIMLNPNNVVIGLETVSIGTLTSTIVHPREVFKTAIALNASSIIVGHNHPSGDPRGSSQDFQITKRLMQAGEILGIDVLDHIIVGNFNNSYVSLKEEGAI